ncbi:MAG: alpha/beta hydrolase [Sandaracinaceae bacterium]|nr:alpha/beta hydrolase [Sandaracinaceae bacterium]
MLRAVQAATRLPERWQHALTGGAIERDGQRMDGPSQLVNALVVRGMRPPLETLTPAHARARLAKLRRGGLPMVVPRVDELRIPTPAGRLALRAYHPEGPGGAPGALLWLHGGGWVLGTLDDHDHVCSCLARDAGVVVVSVDYRLAPEHRYPAAADDAEAAWRHLAANAAALGVDPARLAIGGDSAGGNLAAVVSQRMARTGGPAPRFALLVYPVTDVTREAPSYATFAEGFLLTRDGMRWFIDHYVPDPARRAEPDVSPLLAPSLAGHPPAHVVIAGFDPLRDEGVAYAARLEAEGVPVELARYPTTFHGFFSSGELLPVSREAVARAAHALRRALA